ncbi:ABC transporter permease [Microlunatus antarcticus]|uniref:Taurine transport system permease protein n=1 Tax=Microlunatus antarcticus TaxID=53388 RepID=A0A7W5JYC7_9ACTN|nr:ABC transporter permease subunit [Microlunatus antarcticus]MBB3327932.1 taurine transport system permease protein [Microlunatus antarcticus]
MAAVVVTPEDQRAVRSGSLDASDTSAVLGARGGFGRRAGLRVLAVALLLGVWWVISAWGEPDEVIRPSPGLVWDTFVQLNTVHDGVRGYNDMFLWEHLAISLRRILLGSVIGVVGGLVLGVVLGTVTPIRIMLEPLVTFVRALPPLAYFSLFVIWFGIDESPKIWLLAVAALPPVAVATAAAVVAAPVGLVESARALGARRIDVVRDAVIMSALPEIVTGIRIAVGIAYSSVVAAETINGLPGIGGMVRDAQRYNNTAVVLVGIIAIGISGLVIDGLLSAAGRRVAPWRGRV